MQHSTQTRKATGGIAITQSMIGTKSRAVAARPKMSADKTERENFLSYSRHIVLNSALVAITGPSGEMISSSMKISSLCDHFIAAHDIIMNGKYPDGINPNDANFSIDGKNRWDVAFAKIINTGEDLWFFPSEALVMSSSALDKFYGLAQGGKPLFVEYLELRESHLKKHENATSFLPADVFSNGPNALCTQRGFSVNSIIRNADFVISIKAVACACHAMTGRVACMNLSEAAITREPVSMLTLNSLLSNYVSTEEPVAAAKTRAGGVYTTLYRTLESIRHQAAENNTHPPNERRVTLFEIADSHAGGTYSIRASIRSASATENLEPKFTNGNIDRKNKRVPLQQILTVMQGQGFGAVADDIRNAIREQLDADFAKTSRAQDSQVARPGEDAVQNLLDMIFFTHIEANIDGQKRTKYPASIYTFTQQMNNMVTEEINIGLYSPIMIYFFLKRFGINDAAERMRTQLLDQVFASDVVPRGVFMHLLKHFTAHREPARPRGTTFSGIASIGSGELAAHENAARESRRAVRVAANAASRRSPSPPVRQTAWSAQAVPQRVGSPGPAIPAGTGGSGAGMSHWAGSAKPATSTPSWAVPHPPAGNMAGQQPGRQSGRLSPGATEHTWAPNPHRGSPSHSATSANGWAAAAAAAGGPGSRQGSGHWAHNTASATGSQPLSGTPSGWAGLPSPAQAQPTNWMAKK